MATRHDSEILDQFTRQAEPFLRRHAHSNEGLLALMAECSGAQPEDTVLDVACGPGIVSCYFAKKVRHVTGLDMVPAMLEQAQRYQAEQQIDNVEWKLGNSTNLPFAENSFDRVVTRFSFHHFLEPASALAEMQRVCRPGGTLLVCDVAPRRDVQDRFNAWEILRDPSHTRALTEAEFEAMGQNAGLEPSRSERFSLDMDLEGLLSGSFPRPGDAARIRELFEADIRNGADTLGVAARREGNAVWLTYPVLISAWRKEL